MGGGIFTASSVSAQTLGVFRWRTAPYCNVMHVTVTPVGNFYRLEGYDEQCGGNPRQPLWGIGVMQPNGSITFGFSQVMTPGSVRPVAIRASLAYPELSGSWSDGTSSGTLEFNPNCTVGCGGPRTVPLDAPPAPAPDAATVAALKAQVEQLTQTVAALAARKDD